MSSEKHRGDAARWALQAQADVRAAQASRAAGAYEWACFQAQQAAEKAVKAVWLHLSEDPWGHSVFKLIDELTEPPRGDLLSRFGVAAKQLDKLYVPTRYPNGLPELTPHEAFSDQDAAEAIQLAEAIVDGCAELTDS